LNNKEDAFVETVSGLKANKIKEKSIPLGLTLKNNETNLNPKYTFDNLVVGSFNEVAAAASQAIIKKNEVIYNPLLIYGKTGFGKTHMIQAVGNYIKKNFPNKKVFYLTSEKFQLDVINYIGLKSNKTTDFKSKYRKYDVLIIDDIQFFSKKERTQEELFHLFNYLYDNNKQIILSSDKHPNQIPDLEDRLRSRFSAGMIIDIQTPDFESRVEILKKKAITLGFNVTEEVVEYIATAITGNIRELEGILNNIFIQSQIKGRELNIIDVKELVKNNVKKKQPIDYKKLVSIIANYYNIDEENVYKKSRKKEYVRPRQIAMYLLREDFNYSFPNIGDKIGRRDHTTAMHSYEKIKEEIKVNPILEKELETIRSIY
ncbi:MAG TPA: chromosomal replication initiator protein DnaA, partial [Candidatus Pacebacteria bacterium]|nr:chromosomal replication initiator protein DnaA [Candidatus Paceibacterota bacterium]